MAARAAFQVVVARTGRPLATRAARAGTWRARLVGLLGRRSLSDGEALVFERCRAIHTIGMRFPIDAVFVDRGWRVVALKPHLGSGKLAGPIRKAWGVVELSAGAAARAGLAVGDQLQLTGASHGGALP